MMMHTYKLQTTNIKVAGRQPLNESQKENGGTGAAPSPSETAAHTRPSHWGRAMVHPSTSASHAAAQLGSLARLVGRRLAQGKKPSGHPYIIHPSYQLIQPTSPSGLCRGSTPLPLPACVALYAVLARSLAVDCVWTLPDFWPPSRRCSEPCKRTRIAGARRPVRERSRQATDAGGRGSWQATRGHTAAAAS